MLPVRPKVRILAVCAEHDQRVLQAAFSHSNWELVSTASLAEASALLRENETPVVLCNADLPDGTWRDLVQAVTGWRHPPRLVVIAAEADERLWAEVLQVGYDLLLKPFAPREIFPVLGFAWRSWTMSAGRQPSHSIAAAKPAYCFTS
jgi:DNA-binding response OmpR family regulator